MAILACLVGSIFVAALFAWTSRDLPEPSRLIDRSVAQSTKIYDRTGKTILYDIHGNQKRTLIELSDIPVYTKWAFIATEDKDFYKHKGLSPKHILISMVYYAFSKIGLYHGLVPGGSTLTQQFVKNAILTKEKTIVRKLKEWIISYKIEKKFTKDEILKMYFNEIPFGSTAYGIEAASQTYFAKSAKDLTLGESAILAAMIQAPTYYSNHTDELFNRQKFVLKQLVDSNYITAEEAENAKKEKIIFKPASKGIIAPHFVMYVRGLATEKYGERAVEQDGYKIYTTLDLDKQKFAEEAIGAWAERNQKEFDANNAALVSLDPKTGQILAMVGSKDYFATESAPAGCTPGLDCKFEPNVNVTLRPRQPGSSFKPIVYSTAFKKGYTPETILFDVVTKFKTEIGKDYEPHDYDQGERGPVTIRQALAGSLNIPAVKAIYLAGIDKVLDLADAMGYTTLKDRSRFGLSLVLGGGEVMPLEHASAFGIFATEGKRYPPIAILKIEDSNGKILEEFKPDEKPQQILEPEITRQINSILSDNGARAFVFGANNYLTLGNRPVAAKTGTTNDFHDGWTIGYTPSLVTAVWAGNNDNTAMKGKADGSNIAAPIWRDFMQKALEGTPVENFNTPPPNTATKPVLKGELQSEVIIKIDKSSGKLATDLTPLDQIQEIKYCEYHEILHYINKDDPNGPAPEHPEDDPQYDRWEEAVQRWAKEKMNCQPKPDNLPTETDDLHTGKNKPALSVISPQKGETVATRNYLVKINASAPRGIAKVEYYLDGKLVKTDTESPFEENYLEITSANGDHLLKVIISDDVGNTTWDEFNFHLNTAEEVDFIQWINPVNNTAFNLNDSPLNINIYFRNNPPGKVSFYYQLNGQNKLIDAIDNPTTNASLGWTPPSVGDYKLYIKTVESNGGNKESKKINLKVQ